MSMAFIAQLHAETISLYRRGIKEGMCKHVFEVSMPQAAVSKEISAFKKVPYSGMGMNCKLTFAVLRTLERVRASLRPAQT